MKFGLGLGVVTIDQVLPFQCSARVLTKRPALAKPTAQQSEVPVHATAERLSSEGLGFGVVTIDQALPFQCSASVTFAPGKSLTPTAQQSEALTHATPRSWLPWPGLGLGVVMIDQALPFQCSASVSAPKPLTTEVPTAQQSEVPVHATP